MFLWQRLKEPLVGAQVAALRKALKAFRGQGEVAAFAASVSSICAEAAPVIGEAPAPARLMREDLHLICYEYICA